MGNRARPSLRFLGAGERTSCRTNVTAGSERWERPAAGDRRGGFGQGKGARGPDKRGSSGHLFEQHFRGGLISGFPGL